MGFTAINAQGLSAPPYFLSFLVCIGTTWIADKTRQRGFMIIGLSLIGGVGYIVLVTCKTVAVRYFGVFLAAAGVFPAISNILPWTINNQASDEGKGTGIAVLNVVGQMGPLVGTRLYPDAEGPYYVKGMTVCAVSMGMVVVLAFALRIVLSKENAKMRGKRKEAEGEGLVGGSAEEKDFVYMI